MKNLTAIVITLAAATLSIPCQSAEKPGEQQALKRQVDALLAPLQKPGHPGYAIAVIQDGGIVYEKGIGLADLQHDVPIKPTTPFHIASVSKQFTAFAIHLLAQDGKLSLDDDIHKYIPELADFGAPITLRQLEHHTSGLRDQWELLMLAGWRLDDVITENDILGLLKRQRALNSPPGTAHLYSNTGYTLLGIVVKRVSGQSLPEFAKARIFDPLNMKHTRFVDDYQALIKGRAASYGPNGHNGYDYIALSYSNVGATSLSTTVEDLALWDRNFYDGKVGGKKLLEEMQTVGVLSNGKPLTYASGLVIGKYRGLKTVEHSGGDAGYRSELMRFPEQHLSVITLSNFADSDAGGLSRKIADIYLGKQMDAVPAAAPAKDTHFLPNVETNIDPAKLDAFIGYWKFSPTFTNTIYKEGGKLMVKPTGQPPYPLFVSGERSLFLKVVDGRFAFDAPDQDGVIQGGSYWQAGQTHHFTRSAPPTPLSEVELANYEGEFYSDELHVLYTVSRRDGKLILTYPRGELTLEQDSPNAFIASGSGNRIAYQCSAGDCNTFTVDTGRIRNLQFTRVSIVPTKPGEKTAAFITPGASKNQ
ncbi:serine hydrolase [Duganella sp. FT80W]|uniref:Serine hydrolase n=1 Tax=Duganella guangzhouensis TaxID=2666084 RepID=A0A6I2L4Z6_9BURK|nr:serine hydrolase domain-containing protein [Duganella guangzhouensis]MRW92843.1 serine hydrolase [Duganella guangzhouensis]